MKRHYKVEAARAEAKRAIEKRISEVRTEIRARMIKGEWAAVAESTKELHLLGETE